MMSHAFLTKRTCKYMPGHSYHQPNNVCAMSYCEEEILGAFHILYLCSQI